MAKGRSGSNGHTAGPSSTPTRRAVLTPYASPRPRLLVSGLSPIPLNFGVSYEPLVQVEDRRLFHFDGPDAHPLESDGRPARLTVRDPKRPKRHKGAAYRFGPKVYSQTKAIRAFAEPDRVLVCIRRQKRKEVLFAKRKAGRGGMRPPRRNWMSYISCRG